MKGEVRRVIRDLGFAIIRTKDGREFSFRHTTLPKKDLAKLTKGDVVEFELTVEQDGTHISNVIISRPIAQRGPNRRTVKESGVDTHGQARGT